MVDRKVILLIFGTRPEVIKFAPLIPAFEQHKGCIDLKICTTGQHKEMLQQVLDFFQIEADFSLDLMAPGQSLSGLTSRGAYALEEVLQQTTPDLVLVQGDTTTAFVGALGAYYHQVPVGHIEAGLRSGNPYSPFPEEINRKLIAQIATFHFAPTIKAVENLRKEGITHNVHMVTNTAIDALFIGLRLLRERGEHPLLAQYSYLDSTRRLILVTGHRRESFGDGFQNICQAICTIATRFPDTHIVYPVHLNPNVREPVNRILSGINNVHLIEPVEYPDMLWLMNRAHIILTDSGGVQEEAPSLGKPVLVMRDVTERAEGVDAGSAVLVGTNIERIVETCSALLCNPMRYAQMSSIQNPYGDGKAANRIADILVRSLSPKK
jgi:UDP-N-acetylglucosamine 2-epimerase (non-hydrolysing)